MKNRIQGDAAQARECAEPGERNNPVPWLLGLVAAALSVWGVSYFLLNQNLLEPIEGGAGAVASSTASVTSSTAAIPTLMDGGQIFASRCASCHQASGAGLPGVFPPLAHSEWVNGNDKTVARILLLGINGKISVAGQTYLGSMPAFGTNMSDAEMAAVLTHIRSSFGNQSAAISADMIKSERALLGTRLTPWNGGDELTAQH